MCSMRSTPETARNIKKFSKEGIDTGSFSKLA
jgi:hypothetical protein